MDRRRVVVAMSGGVDSSVAALLLAQAGYEVIGVTLRLWTLDRPHAAPMSRSCCSVEDIDDARRVCQAIGARHYVVNAEREFRARVVDYFFAEYERGRTPHPCIACNDRIKFDFLLERSLQLGADAVATGHYARIAESDGLWRLLRARDPRKDQSYVLFGLGQEQLRRLLFPIGDLPKEETRRLAAEAGLPVAGKPDSQEICFVPQGDYRELLSRWMQPAPGEIVDLEGQVLGTHPGVGFFTVGQRRGLGLTSSAPRYVVDIDAATRRVVVGPEEALYAGGLRAGRVNWIAGSPPQTPLDVGVKSRYKSQETPATLYAGDGSVEVRFHQPQRAITPGQAVVFYSGEAVLGGGFIEGALHTAHTVTATAA